MSGEDALFNLRWDAQRSALLGSMAALYREEAFVDTTMVADNKIFKAHKLLLSASSPYLKHMLESVPCSQHAVIFMPHISALDLGNLLKFIYEGEIKINKRSLKSFLSVAKLLRIKGMDFELNEDLETSITPSAVATQAQNLSISSSSSSSSGKLRQGPTSDVVKVEGDAQSDNAARKSPKEMNGGCFNGNGLGGGSSSSEDESKTRPAVVGGSGRSSDSVSSPLSTTSPRNNGLSSRNPPSNATGGMNGGTPSRDEDVELHHQDDSHGDSEDKEDTALNLHIGRYHHHHNDGGENESIDVDVDSREGEDETLHDNDMDDYDDEDDDGSFSMSIQPEVSLRESDESYNVNDRSRASFKPTNFTNSLNLSLLGSSAMSITQTAPGLGSSGSGSSNASLSLQQQLALRHFSKMSRPLIPSKAHLGSPGLGGNNGANIPSINEGILMRMMREPLQGTASSKPVNNNNNSSSSGFFDIPLNDPNLHSAGLRKQKRYVQCTSCSKVLSSLSALKRHMEDVHCARIQGKCLLCGRVYSSRNSLLTHVYSAHKKHHDYKAVARIIRESDFEQFATA